MLGLCRNEIQITATKTIKIKNMKNIENSISALYLILWAQNWCMSILRVGRDLCLKRDQKNILILNKYFAINILFLVIRCLFFKNF